MLGDFVVRGNRSDREEWYSAKLPRLDVFSPEDTGGHDIYIICIARIAARAPAKQDSSAAR